MIVPLFNLFAPNQAFNDQSSVLTVAMCIEVTAVAACSYAHFTHTWSH